MKKREKINKDYLVLGGLVALTLTSGVILNSIKVNADDSVVDDISITVPVSCSLSSTGNDSHTATIPNGIYSANYTDTTSGVDYTNGIGTTTIKAYCNDNNGFAIYAAGYTGEAVGEENSNKLVGTTTGIGNIDTNLNTAGNTSGWSMKLTATGDSGDTTNSPLTIDSAPNVSLPSQAESGTTPASFSDYHVVPNEYVKVAHKNSGTDMTQTTGGATLTTTYAAYISPTQPAGTYTGKVIYVMVHPAMAPAPGPKSLDTATTMQDVTYCSNKLPEGQVYTLTDARDNQQYKVARLADGNCWMLDNLALDPTDATTAANMNENNTNATSAAINNLLNGGSTTTGWSSVAVEDVDTGFTSYTAPMINNASKDTLVTSYGPAATNGQAKVGLYYNYCAATVGTYCYASGSGVDVADTIIDAPYDLCPANWRMPTGGSNGEYYKLFNKYSTTQDATSTASLQYNLSTPLSGSYLSSADYQGSWGYWWSSSYSYGSNMYTLSVISSYVGPSNGYDRSNGYTMRCLVGD